MPGIDEAKPFLHAAFANELFNCIRDVDVIAPMRRFKPEMFGQGFHIRDIKPNPLPAAMVKT